VIEVDTSMKMRFEGNTVTRSPDRDGTDEIRVLAAATGGTVVLVGWSDDDSLRCLVRCDPPPQPLAIPPMDGGVLLPGTEALLHVLLAWSPPDVLQQRLTRLHRAPAGLRNPALLALRLARVRAVGHDLVAGGLRDEVTAIAAPLRNEDGEVVGSLGLVAPSVYLEDLDLPTITFDLRRQAAGLETSAVMAG
jgi:DNA-binding IclR family transcriptional regulator